MYEWDLDHGSKGWAGDVNNICKRLHLPTLEDNVLYDMDNVKGAILHYSKVGWREEAESKPKFRTYIQIRQPEDPPILASRSIKRYNRSLLAELLLRILPMEL